MLEFDEETTLQEWHKDPPVYQRWLRIRLSVYAFSYEFKAISLVDDGEYDRLSDLVDVSVDTGNPLLDKFFKEEFVAYSGSWIQKHPELDKLEALWYLYHKNFPENLYRIGNSIYEIKKGRKKN